jgi:ribonuclease D
MARGGTGSTKGHATLAEFGEQQVALDERGVSARDSFVYVEDKPTSIEVVRYLVEQPSLALDIETTFATGDGVHGGTISLIQLGIDEREKFVFDMQALADPAAYKPMLQLLRRPTQRHVVHHAIYEQPWLWYTHAVKIGRLFDTEVAASLLSKVENPGVSCSLKAVLLRELGIEMSKDEQSSHWGERPLSFGQRRYAAEDVAHLNRLADILEARMRLHPGMWEEFVKRCDARYATSVASIHKMQRYQDDDYARVAAMVERASDMAELRRVAEALPTFVLAHHHRSKLMHRLNERIAKRSRR